MAKDKKTKEEETPETPEKEVEEETKSEETPEETPTEESKEESAEEAGEPEEAEEAPEEETPKEEEVPEEEPKQSRREKLRIVDVLQKYGPPPAQAPVEQPTQPGMDYSQALEADPATVQQLEADRQAYGKTQFEQGSAQALKQAETIEWRTMLHIDAPQIESKYSFLNPKDEKNFNPAAADALNKMYLGAAGYDDTTKQVANPNIRYADYIDSIMELADELAENKATATTKNIAKQAAKTGIRPDGSTVKRLNLNQAPDKMTDEELDTIINQAMK